MRAWPRVLSTWASVACVVVSSATPTTAETGVRHPLQVAPEGRHLIGADGEPVFFLADAPWNILARLDRTSTSTYLDARRAQGFDALLVSLLVSDDFPNGTGANREGHAPLIVSGDFSTPNEAYFEHVDWFLDAAGERGFTVFLAPAYLGHECRTEGLCAAMLEAGVDAMRAWGRWVGARYAEVPHLVWVHGGDVDAARFGALEIVDAVAEGIREVDDQHLHTAHCSRNHSAVHCYDRPWLDFNTCYSDCQRTPEEVRHEYARTPAIPFVYIEGIYEFEYDFTDRCIRGQAYTAMLGGAVGHFYGSGRIWDFPRDEWEKGLDTEGVRAMQALGELMRSRPWARLVPEHPADLRAVARADDGSTLLAYLPHGGTFVLAPDRIAGPTMTAWWFDPSNGRSVSIGSLPTDQQQSFFAPSRADWVLVVDRGDLGLGAPGRGEVESGWWRTLLRRFRRS